MSVVPKFDGSSSYSLRDIGAHTDILKNISDITRLKLFNYYMLYVCFGYDNRNRLSV